MLHNLASSLNQMSDVQEIGEAICRELRTIIEYHNCRVHLISDDGSRLMPVAFRGELTEYQGETFAALMLPVGQGITGRVAVTGESYYAPNTNDDPVAVIIPGTPDVDESLLVVPLKGRDRIIGTVALAKLGVDQFDDQDRWVLEVLASHASVAIENARLLQREREAANRARESEARKSAIVESAFDSLIVIDPAGRIVEFNPAAERTFGYTRDQVLGSDMAELIIPDRLRQRHRNGMRQYLRTGHSRIMAQPFETTARRADGTEFAVEVAITRVNLPGPPLFTGYVRDITARKQAEAEIERALQAEREATQRLRELDQLKNTFLEAVSHDLRTPLAAVLGLALTLERREIALTPQVRQELLGRLAANARKLERILSNVLDLERLIRGVAEPRRAPTDVGMLIRKVVSEADFLAGRDVHLEVGSLIADVDAGKLERIVENLLVNTARHTPRQSQVWIRLRAEPGCILILVEDDGPGVPPELRTTIFEPFQRGLQDQPSPGLGLGLSLVARFAELHGGRVWVQERAGGGASFRVQLPWEQGEPAALP
jgi:PAS domain S-box-containing protein